MKKNIYVLTFIFLLLQTNVESSSPKLSPLTKKYLNEIRKMNSEQSMLRSYVYKSDGFNNYISALIRVNNNINEFQLRSLGIKIGTKAGKIWTTQIPLYSIEAFILLSGIDYIQLDEPAFPTLDFARIDTRVDSVHSGIGLAMPYNGEGVVVGIVDAGFDFSSPAFFDTTGTGYRVKKVWMQKNITGPAPSGYVYGTELTDSMAMWSAGKAAPMSLRVCSFQFPACS